MREEWSGGGGGGSNHLLLLMACPPQRLLVWADVVPTGGVRCQTQTHAGGNTKEGGRSKQPDREGSEVAPAAPRWLTLL